MEPLTRHEKLEISVIYLKLLLLSFECHSSFKLLKSFQNGTNFLELEEKVEISIVYNLSLLFSDVESYNTIPRRGVIHNTLFHKLFVCF